MQDSPFKWLLILIVTMLKQPLDRTATTGGCQFLGNRLISWQCKSKLLLPRLQLKLNMWQISILGLKYWNAESLTVYISLWVATDVNMQSRMDGRICYVKQKCVMSQKPRQIKRGQDIKIPQSSGPPEKVGDEAVHKELGDRMERAATTASSLEAEQDSGDINRTQSMATLNEPSP
ncbi:hypothetical protein Tco_1202779 [Tanacetum coccineum]